MPKQIKNYPIITVISDEDLFLIQADSDQAYKRVKASTLKAFLGTSSASTSGTQQPTFPVSAWYRISASAISNAVIDGATVTQLADLSDNHYFASGAGSSPPKYKKNVFNGRSAFYFDGSGYFDLGNAHVIPDPGDFVIFQVAAYSNDSTGFGCGGDQWGIQMRGKVNYAVCNGSLVESNFSGVAYNSLNIFAWGRFNGQWQTYVNGNPVTGGNNANNIRGTVNGFQQKTLIGAKWDNGVSTYMQGYIADTCVKLNPTIADINAIGNYYNSQYNSSWSIVS